MSEALPGYTVAITGGVAAGKSAVTRRFANLGIDVLDADLAARDVVEPGSDGLQALVAAFGEDILGSDGRLDRPAMRRRVFADPAARQTLESIVHPRIRRWMLERAGHVTSPYYLLVVPLLAENIERYRWVKRILVVDAPEAVQLARLALRDGIDETLARRMLANQATRADRLALADDVIDNEGDERALDHTVAELHRRYLALATADRQAS